MRRAKNVFLERAKIQRVSSRLLAVDIYELPTCEFFCLVAQFSADKLAPSPPPFSLVVWHMFETTKQKSIDVRASIASEWFGI